VNSSIHFYKEYILKIWNFTEFREFNFCRKGYEFHQFREEIDVITLENEEIRGHNNAGQAEKKLCLKKRSLF